MSTLVISPGAIALTAGKTTVSTPTDSERLTVDGEHHDVRHELLGGAPPTPRVLWDAANAAPASFAYAQVVAEVGDDAQVELAFGTTDVVVFNLREGVPLVLPIDDVMLRSAHDAAPFDSPGAAAKITRISARNNNADTSNAAIVRVSVVK